MIRAFACISATAIAYSLYVLYANATAQPITTLVAVRLTEQKMRATMKEDPSGVIVLELLKDIGQWVDDELRMARSAIEHQLSAEVQLADAVTASDGTSKDQLVQLGQTARALADVNHCEFELRAVAALAAQLTIDVDPSATGTERALLVNFENRCQSVYDILVRLASTEIVRVIKLDGLAEGIRARQEALRVAWGVEAERRADFSIEEAIRPESPRTEEYEAIGRIELQEWRSR